MQERKTVADYCKDNVLVLPEALVELKDVVTLAKHHGSAIFYKDLESDLVDIEFYCTLPCIVYIEKGQEVLTTADNKTLKLAERTAVLLPAGLHLHSDFVRSTQSLKAYLLFFNESQTTRFLASQKTKQHDINEAHLYSVTCGDEIQQYFDSIVTLSKLNDKCPELLTIKMLEFLHLLNMQDKSKALATRLSARSAQNPKRNILRLMEKQGVFRLSVADLAHLSGRSVSSFNRDFKYVYNMPPKQWLTKKRMDIAKDLLSTKQYSVTETAIDVGYENISHFIKQFKTTFGKTPKQFINDA